MSRAKKDIQPHWRPNFVNTSELPDIKVVRTDFIINFFSIILMLMAGSYVLQREYRAHALKNTIAEMEQRISAAEAEDNASLRVSQEFRDSAANIAELEKFYATPLIAHEFLRELAMVRPEELIYTRISMGEAVENQASGPVVTYRINIGGEVRSLTVLDDFKGTLSEWEPLQHEGYELDIDESLQGRDSNTGIFPYTLNITLKPAQQPAAGSKAEGAGA